MKNKFTLAELEKLLPEYLFGEMSNEDKLHFEESAKDYPEILSEMQNVRDTFEKFEKFDLKSTIKQESKNLSVKVQEKKSKSRKNSIAMGVLPKYVYPSLGLLVLVYFLFFTDTFNSNTSLETNEFAIFNDSDSTLIHSENYEIIPDLIHTNLDYNDNLSLGEYIEDNSTDYIQIENLSQKFNAFHINYESLINHLNEEEFTNILEELQNEKFDV